MIAPHVFPIRVYYEDTDFSGFVYHASYLRFLERGRTEFLRTLGLAQSDLRREANGLVFVVSRVVVDFRKAAVMDDQLTIATDVEAIRGASMRMAQAVRRDALVLVEARVTVAAVSAGRAVRLPLALTDRLKRGAGAVARL